MLSPESARAKRWKIACRKIPACRARMKKQQAIYNKKYTGQCHANPTCIKRKRAGGKEHYRRCVANPRCKAKMYQRSDRNRSRCNANPLCKQRRQALFVEARRIRLYGLTKTKTKALCKEQGGVCAICKLEPCSKLVVDHDHRTGCLRGLLCNRCNLGLGLFHDSPDRLRSAAIYLSKKNPDLHRRGSPGSK